MNFVFHFSHKGLYRLSRDIAVSSGSDLFEMFAFLSSCFFPKNDHLLRAEYLSIGRNSRLLEGFGRILTLLASYHSVMALLL